MLYRILLKSRAVRFIETPAVLSVSLRTLLGVRAFLIAMTFILLAVLIAVYIFLPERFTLIKVALSMIIAGAIGNLIDRLAYRQVRDFVGVNMFGNMVFCNFADFWITFGTALAILDIMFYKRICAFSAYKKS